MAQPVQPELESPDTPTGPSATAAGGVSMAAEPAAAAAAIPAPRKKRPRVFFYAAVGWMLLVVVCAVFADVLPIKSPVEQVIPSRLSAPGENGFILGADGNGRDILSRLVFGARVSLIVAFTAVATGSIVGGLLGLTAGFIRGWYERIVMALIDVVIAFPALILLLALVSILESQSLGTIAAVFGLLSIPAYTRVARATTLAVSEREYVMAAKALGATRRRILLRELLPNVALPVLAFGLVAVGIAIVAEGSLAFLGLSVELPNSTWGLMIAEGRNHLRVAPHVALVPSAAMFLTVLSLNYVGDSLRSRFDVRESAL